MARAKRSIVGRFFGILTNHHHMRRGNLRLPLTVSLLDSKTKVPVAPSAPALRGYLRDISKTGLSIVMPSVHFGDPYLMCSGYTLLLRIEFPNRTVSIQAAPARFDRVAENQDEYSYLIGARILQMTKSDRRYLNNYIKRGGMMPEVMNSIVRRLYDSLINRIHVRQSGMRLPLTVSLLDSETWAVGAQRLPPLPGYLRDISKTGLSIIVPPVHNGNRYPIGSHFTLRITIEHPNGAINIKATPVRYDWFNESQSERKHLIGARISQLTRSDRKALVQYIQQVKKRESVGSKASFAHDAKSF